MHLTNTLQGMLPSAFDDVTMNGRLIRLEYSSTQAPSLASYSFGGQRSHVNLASCAGYSRARAST